MAEVKIATAGGSPGDAADPAARIADLEARNHQLNGVVAGQQWFTSMVSHELRTPLTLIIGLAETLITRWEDIDHAQALPLLQRLANAAGRQKLLLDNLLDVAMIQSGQLTAVALRRTLALDIVQTALGMLAPESSIEVDVPSDLACLADATRASQTLVNLLGNAHKYGEPPFRLAAGSRDDRVEFRVRDHGKGVPAEFEADLFEPFRRANDGRRLTDGIGLGLHIVQWLVTVQDGEVWHERPTDGPGAVFVVSLPRFDPHRHDVEAEPVTASGQANPGASSS